MKAFKVYTANLRDLGSIHYYFSHPKSEGCGGVYIIGNKKTK